MEFSELKNCKTVTGFIKKPFRERIKFKVEHQFDEINDKPVYKLYTYHKRFLLEIWIENQDQVNFFDSKTT